MILPYYVFCAVKIIDNFEKWQLGYFSQAYPQSGNYFSVELTTITSKSINKSLKIYYNLTSHATFDFLNNLSYNLDFSDVGAFEFWIKGSSDNVDRFWFILQDEDGDMFVKIFDNLLNINEWTKVIVSTSDLTLYYQQGNGVLSWNKIRKYQFRVSNLTTLSRSSTVYIDLLLAHTNTTDIASPEVVRVYPQNNYKTDNFSQPIAAMIVDKESDINPDKINIKINNVDFNFSTTKNFIEWNAPMLVVYPHYLINFTTFQVVDVMLYAEDLSGKSLTHSWSFLVSTYSTINKTIEGTFIQPSDNVYWSLDKWRSQFEYMKQIGMNTLIIQWVLEEDISCYYPSTNWASVRKSDNFVYNILTLANSFYFDVYIGLRYSTPDWETWGWPAPYSQVASWLNNEEEKNKIVIDEIWQLYKNHSSFKGWYIVYEIEDLHWNTEEFKNILKQFITNLATYAKSKDSSKKVMISPYFGKNVSVDFYESWWRDILSNSKVDIVALQDGVGCKRVNLYSEALPYFLALKNACEVNNVSFWYDLETFEQIHGWPVDNLPFEAVPSNIQVIKEQIKFFQDIAEKIIQFEFSYMNPEGDQNRQKLYYDYLEFYKSLKSTQSTQPPPKEDSPPIVTIISPQQGSYLSGLINVEISVLDDKGVNRVEIFLNNELKVILTTSPYIWSWNTLEYNNTQYILKVVAYDTSNQKDEKQILVNVMNVIEDKDEIETLSKNVILLTPNNDNLNDEVYFKDAKSEVKIYDKKGNLVKKLKPENPIWSGKDENGNFLPTDIYIVSYLGLDSKLKTKLILLLK